MSAQGPFKPYPSVRGPAKIFLYGDPGTLKTRRAMGMPKPLAIIDMEGGACDYQDLGGPGDMYLPTRSVAELEKAIGWVEANPDKVGTLIVDPITVVWQQLQQGHIARALKRGWIRVKGGDRLPITEPEEVPFEITDWTKLKTHHAAIITRLMNLSCHVVIIARGMDKTNEKGEVKGYGWDGEKNLAFSAKIVIETRLKGDTVIKDRFTKKYKDKEKVEGRVDLLEFVAASGKEVQRVQLEDAAADGDAGEVAPAAAAPRQADATWNLDTIRSLLKARIAEAFPDDAKLLEDPRLIASVAVALFGNVTAKLSADELTVWGPKLKTWPVETIIDKAGAVIAKAKDAATASSTVTTPGSTPGAASTTTAKPDSAGTATTAGNDATPDQKLRAQLKKDALKLARELGAALVDEDAEDTAERALLKGLASNIKLEAATDAAAKFAAPTDPLKKWARERLSNSGLIKEQAAK